jgi:hypothetical protein
VTFTFICFRSFTRQWLDAGLDDEDLRHFENALAARPKAGDVIPGAGGLRKIRVALPGKGKRGSARAAYVLFLAYDHIVLITLYLKNDKADLTSEEKKAIRQRIAETEAYVRKQAKGD